MEAANNPRAISPFHPLVFQWRAADSSSSDYCKHSWGGNGRCTREEELRIGSILFFSYSLLFSYPLSFHEVARYRIVVLRRNDFASLGFCSADDFVFKVNYTFFYFSSQKERIGKRSI